MRSTPVVSLLILALAACGGSPTTTTPPPSTNVLAVVSGDGQHARLTRELPNPIVISVRTTTGAAVSGATVTLTPSSGSVGSASATSDANGQVTIRWTLGSTAGAQTLTVRLGNGTSLTITATADPAVLVSIQPLDGDRQQAVVNTAVGVAPSVVVRDAQGALAAGLAVKFTVTAGGGTVGSATATTDGNGRASVGRWTLGSGVGDNTLSVTPADADLVATSPMVFSAVAVATGGVASSPMRSYTLNAATVTTVQDTVAGAIFRFTGGAHGTLDVARVLSGPTTPLGGTTRFRATYTGTEVVELAVVKPVGGEAQAFMFCDLTEPVADNTKTSRWWGVPRSRVVGDTVFFFLQSGSIYGAPPLARTAAAPFAPAASWAASAFFPAALTSPVVQAYATVPLATTTGYTAYGLYKEAVQQAIDWWIANLPSSEGNRTFAAMSAHNPYSVSIGVRQPDEDYSYYLYTSSWGRPYPLFFFDTLNIGYRERPTRHEVGHYISHMMLGDAAYKTLVANGPGSGHQPGEIAKGFRGSLSEEYAYSSQFFMSGDLDGYDLRSLSTTLNLNDLFSGKSPNAVDFPSLEGFGAAMLAAVTRTGTDTMIHDVYGDRTRSPALGIRVTTVLGVLAQGPQNPNQLRAMVRGLVASDEMLASLLEPIGWSYWGTGKVVDPAGQPIAGATVRSVVKVDGVEYLTPGSAFSGSDGSFVLPRLYPGTSMLRIYRPSTNGIDSTDAKEWTVPWETATNTGQVFGNLVLVGLPAYNTISISVNGFTSPNTLGTSNCPSNFYVSNQVYNGVWDQTQLFPLLWSGNHFGTTGSVNYSAPATDGSLASRGSGSLSISGTLERMRPDSIWISLSGSQSDRAEAFVPYPAPGAWVLEVLRPVSLSIASFGMASNGGSPATYKGTLHGPAAAVVISAATMSYYNVSALIPTFFPYSCSAYSLNPTNADVQITLRIVTP